MKEEDESASTEDIVFCGSCGVGKRVVLKEGVVCTSCGVVSDYGSLFLPSGSSLHVFDCVFANPANEKKTYKHVFYWNERMAQFRMEEPPICEEHQERLREAYYRLLRDREIDGPAAGGFIGKPTVKRIIVAAQLTTNKYLEKYLSIGYMLTGVMPYESKPSFDLINSMTRDFCVMIKLFFCNERFGRHAMINYNLIIRETLKRNGGAEYVCLFPELKTKNKLNRAMQIYESMWYQMMEASLISALSEELRFRKIENAKTDREEIVPRITSRSHLKRKYVQLGGGPNSGGPHPKRHRKIP